jgi:hypothetical protein
VEQESGARNALQLESASTGRRLDKSCVVGSARVLQEVALRRV